MIGDLLSTAAKSALRGAGDVIVAIAFWGAVAFVAVAVLAFAVGRFLT